MRFDGELKLGGLCLGDPPVKFLGTASDGSRPRFLRERHARQNRYVPGTRCLSIIQRPQKLVAGKGAAFGLGVIDGKLDETSMDLQENIRRLESVSSEATFQFGTADLRPLQLDTGFEVSVPLEQANIGSAKSEQRDGCQSPVMVQQRKRKIGAA